MLVLGVEIHIALIAAGKGAVATPTQDHDTVVPLRMETDGPATVAVALEVVAAQVKDAVPGVAVQAGAAEKMEDPNSIKYVLHVPVMLQVLAVVKLPVSVTLAIFPELGVNVAVPTTISLLHD